MADFDLLIRGGTIIDGSGAEPFMGDVAVRGDRIVAIGNVAGSAAEEIDAQGLIVTPGFVDIHTHYDGQAIWSDTLSPSSSHGVTTVVTGNCGVGFAPCRPEDHEMLIRVMEGVEDIPGVVMAEGLSWDWETFPQYLDALEARPRDIDIGAYLPHSPLRVYVMGRRGADREPATKDDLARMRTLSREAIEAGALGIASSRLFMHRTKAGEQIPSFAASDEELKAIAGGMADAGSGIVQLVLDAPHATWRDEMDHLVAVVESCGRPATFTLGTANRGEPVWLDAMARVEAANARGAFIKAQVLPRPIGLIAGFDLSTNPFCLCPSWKAIEDLPFAERIERLRDPAVRETLIADAPDEGNPLAMIARNWEWMFPLSDPPNYEPAANSSIAAQARAQERSPEEVAYDWLLGDDGHAMLYNALGNYHDGKLDAVYDLMVHPDVVVGLGDGGAHYGAICDASYPTFMLTYWARDRAGPRLGLAHAVKMLAATPAGVVQLRDRGRIAIGYKADLNVIDLAALRLHAPEIRHDLPGGGRRLDQHAAGYRATIVSGEIIRRDDQATGRLPGRVVRGAREAPPAAVA
jgi:N-acyl-D-aspartate/D-glutamate deacylase